MAASITLRSPVAGIKALPSRPSRPARAQVAVSATATPRDDAVKFAKRTALVAAGIGAIGLAMGVDPVMAMIHETANGGWDDTLSIHAKFDSLPKSGLDLRPWCDDPFCPDGDPFTQPAIYPALFGWFLPQALAVYFKGKQAVAAKEMAAERGIDLESLMKNDEFQRTFNGMSTMAQVGKIKAAINLQELKQAAKQAGIPESAFAGIDTTRNNNYIGVQYKNILKKEGVPLPELSLAAGNEQYVILAPVAFVLLVCARGIMYTA